MQQRRYCFSGVATQPLCRQTIGDLNENKFRCNQARILGSYTSFPFPSELIPLIASVE
jgi:hypothetical protein